MPEKRLPSDQRALGTRRPRGRTEGTWVPKVDLASSPAEETPSAYGGDGRRLGQRPRSQQRGLSEERKPSDRVDAQTGKMPVDKHGSMSMRRRKGQDGAASPPEALVSWNSGRKPNWLIRQEAQGHLACQGQTWQDHKMDWRKAPRHQQQWHGTDLCSPHVARVRGRGMRDDARHVRSHSLDRHPRSQSAKSRNQPRNPDQRRPSSVRRLRWVPKAPQSVTDSVADSDGEVRRLPARGRWKGKELVADQETHDKIDWKTGRPTRRPGDPPGLMRWESTGAVVRASSQPVYSNTRYASSDSCSDVNDEDWELQYSRISAATESETATSPQSSIWLAVGTNQKARPGLDLLSLAPRIEATTVVSAAVPLAGRIAPPPPPTAGGTHREEASWSARLSQNVQVPPVELEIEAWLRGIDGDRGFLFANFWPRVKQANFNNAAEVLARYQNPGGGTDFERFCQDFGVEKVGHRRLFQKWFTDSEACEGANVPTLSAAPLDASGWQ